MRRAGSAPYFRAYRYARGHASLSGFPKRRAIQDALKQLALEQFEDVHATSLDYLIAWVESGKTMGKLAKFVAQRLGWPEAGVSLQLLSLAVKSEHGAERVEADLILARKKSAQAIVDESLDIADEHTSSQLQAAQAGNRIKARQWLAERRDREAFGAAKAASVTVSIGSLHMDALRAPVPALPVSESVRAIASAITEDAEVITDGPILT